MCAIFGYIALLLTLLGHVARIMSFEDGMYKAFIYIFYNFFNKKNVQLQVVGDVFRAAGIVSKAMDHA